MARIIDVVSASIITLVASFVWGVLLFSRWEIALIFSCALTACTLCVLHTFSKRKRTPYGEDRLALEFALKGNEYLIKTLLSAIKNNKFENGCNYILLKNSVIIANFKFSALSPSDMQSICSLATKLERNVVFVIAKAIDRKSFQVSIAHDIKVNIVKIREVYKFLKKHDALPSLKKIKEKPTLRALSQTIFNRQNFKHYTFSGIVLMLVSLITPLKIYYIAIGSLLLVLAIACLTPLGNGSLSSPSALSLLEKESEEEYKRE